MRTGFRATSHVCACFKHRGGPGHDSPILNMRGAFKAGILLHVVGRFECYMECPL
jgi:hypothetical protein